MAKIKQSNAQQDALKYISASLKELEKLKGMMSGDAELTARSSSDGKNVTMKIDLGTVKTKALLKSYGANLTQEIESIAAKNIIELEEEEKKLCAFFKSKAIAKPKSEPVAEQGS